jgi:hypothetical protein
METTLQKTRRLLANTERQIETRRWEFQQWEKNDLALIEQYKREIEALEKQEEHNEN